jgi:CBS domain-containing protein
MQVEELMTPSIQCCSPEDSLEHAAEIMWSHDCGCVPVCQQNGGSKTIGVLTDRDICMCALFQGRPLRELHVSDAMAREVVSIGPHDSLAQAERAMQDAQIRRLPVIDEQGTLVGILSLSDIAREAARQQTSSKRQITDTEVNDTLAAICQPNSGPLPA